MVQQIMAQAIVFAVCWTLAYAIGHRVRRGHWTLSLLVIAIIQGVGYWTLSRIHPPVPPLVWWLPAAVIGVLTIALCSSATQARRRCQSPPRAMKR